MQEKIIVHITTSNPVQTQEGVYKLSRSRRNEASLKQKLKEQLQRTSNCWLGPYVNCVDTVRLFIENTRNAREIE